MVWPTLIELAVRVLRAAVERARGSRLDGPEVRPALRCILPHASDRQLFVEFWTYAGQLLNAHRAYSCATVLDAIGEDTRAAGRYPSAEDERRRLLADGLMQAARD